VVLEGRTMIFFFLPNLITNQMKFVRLANKFVIPCERIKMQHDYNQSSIDHYTVLSRNDLLDIFR
jgi:hypothetical protein